MAGRIDCEPRIGAHAVSGGRKRFPIYPDFERMSPDIFTILYIFGEMADDCMDAGGGAKQEVRAERLKALPC